MNKIQLRQLARTQLQNQRLRELTKMLRFGAMYGSSIQILRKMAQL